DLHETVYPLLTELLYAMALALRGPVACRLVQWLFGVALALNVAALARPVLGERSRWAATVALLVPAVSNGMGAPLNDVALAAFGNAALVAWSRWSDRPSLRSAALAGVLAGFALGVKYPALVLAGLIAAAMIVSSTDRSRSLRHAMLFGAVTLLVGGAWYARSYAYTGNPVYPFFRNVFGGAGLDEVLDPIKRPMAVTFWNLATAIVPMTLQPSRFDSVSHQFGPLFLLVLPAILWERAPRRVWAVVAIGYAFLTICLTQRQSMRFVLIAAGPMAVGVVWVASTWWDRRGFAARSLLVLLVGCLGFEAAIAAGRARHGINVILGRESADAFLSRREPTYRVGRWIDENLPSSARIVGQDHRGFYIPRRYTMELAHRRRTGLGARGEPA
ncbi:MAG TPA: glycosyltransferase family 39 protein, partial [Isosphaeraceae bacterium]